MKKHYKLIAIVCLISSLLISFQSRGQVSTYTFTQSAGTYTALTTGTVLVTGVWDNAVYPVTIPFNFSFNGTAYTSLNVSTNGFITFGATAPAATNYTPISSTTAYDGAISAETQNLLSTTGEIRYDTVGIAPNREVVVQWSNAYRTGQTGDNISFQIRLHETTNQINIVYGSHVFTTTVTNAAQVGLRGLANTDFNNRALTAAQVWLNNTTAGTVNTNTCRTRNTAYPATGTTFTWTPLAACSGIPTAGTAGPTPLTGCSGNTVSMTVSGYTTGFSGIGLQWQQSADGSTGWANVTGGTGANAAAYTSAPLTASIYYRCRVICSSGPDTVYTNNVQVNVGNINTFPWTENFDAMATIGNSIVPSCWKVESGSGTPWASMNAAGETYNDPSTAPNYITCYYSPYPYDKYLITPGFELVAGASYDFSFKYVGDGYTGWTADARYNTTQTGTGSTLLGAAFLSSTTTATATYTTVTRTFTPATTGTYYFMVHVNNNVTPYYLGFDDFSVTQLSACTGVPTAGTAGPTPITGCSGNPAVMSVTGNTTGSGVFLQWQESVDGISGWTNVSGGSGANSASFTSAPLSSSAYFRCRVICSSGPDTVYSNNVQVNVGNIATFPWTENFDAMTTIGNSIVPSCWKIESATGTPWASMNAAGITYNDPASAPNYITCSYTPSATDKYIITPGLDLTAGVSYDFSFKYAGDTYSGWTADARYNTSQTGTGSTMLGTAFLSSTTTTTATYTTVTRTFIPTTSGTYFFMVHINSTSVPYYLGLDDFSVVIGLPPCTAPTLVTATPNSFCGTGGTSLLNATSVGNTINWFTSPTGGTSIGSSSSGADYSAAVTATTTYYAEASGTGCNATRSAGVLVTVNSNPAAVTVTPSAATICSGTIQQLDASGGAPAPLAINETFPTATLPVGWTAVIGTGDLIGTVNSALAGGTAYEAKITGNSFTAITDILYYGPINTTGYTSLTLQWNNWVDWYSSTYPFSVAVQTSTDHVTWHNTSWVTNTVTADIGPAVQTITLNTADVGSSTFYLAFTMSGQTFGANAWYIDNVNISGSSTPAPITWTPTGTLYSDAAATVPYIAGTAATTVYAVPTTNTTYSATATTSAGCTSAGTAVITMTLVPAPTGDAVQTFCNTATVADLIATGTSVQWYDAAIGGNLLTPTTGLIDGHHYYASQTIAGCESSSRLDVTFAVTTNLPATVSIEVDQNNVCTGASVTFTATPVNGGTPSYQWYVNSAMAGTNSPTYSYTPANGDIVYVVMTSSISCVSGSPATSGPITMIVGAPQPVSVNAVVDMNTVCAGTAVTFTATPTNGGSSPTYQWYLNSFMVGTNQPTYTYVPTNLDQVSVVLTSSLSCVSGNPAFSNSLAIFVNTCTGVENQTSDLGALKVYPNPANDKLFVNFEDISETPVLIKMFNAVGQLIFESNTPLDANRSGIDVSHMSAGSYTLQTIFDNDVVNKTVVVK